MIEISMQEVIIGPQDSPTAEEWVVAKKAEGLYLKAAFRPQPGYWHIRMGNPKVDALIEAGRAQYRNLAAAQRRGGLGRLKDQVERMRGSLAAHRRTVPPSE